MDCPSQKSRLYAGFHPFILFKPFITHISPHPLLPPIPGHTTASLLVSTTVHSPHGSHNHLFETEFRACQSLLKILQCLATTFTVKQNSAASSAGPPSLASCPPLWPVSSHTRPGTTAFSRGTQQAPLWIQGLHSGCSLCLCWWLSWSFMAWPPCLCSGSQISAQVRPFYQTL